MRNSLKTRAEAIFKKTVCGILIVSTVFTAAACSGGDDKTETEAPKAEKAASVSNGELTGESTVIGVGSTKVLYDEYKIYSWFLKNQYEDVMSAEVWNYTLEGTTIGQTAIEDILRLIIQIKVMNKAAAAQGISLGVDEKEDIDYKADQYLATIPAEIWEENGITAERMHAIFEENEISRKMYDVVTGGVEANIDEASMQAAKVLMLHLQTKADGSDREAVKGQANALALELTGYKGNFYSFVKEKTGKAPEEVIIGKMDSRANLINTALTMQRYTTSGVIEENDGFYLIHCLKSNTSGLNKVYREQYISEQQNTTFQAAYENWAEKYEVKVSKSLLAN
ncbi:MAG: hypothetical protein NC293_05160 [Roseburia sp.]|nr:hypothetical protein [Roseburia sp.]